MFRKNWYIHIKLRCSFLVIQIKLDGKYLLQIKNTAFSNQPLRLKEKPPTLFSFSTRAASISKVNVCRYFHIITAAREVVMGLCPLRFLLRQGKKGKLREAANCLIENLSVHFYSGVISYLTPGILKCNKASNWNIKCKMYL